MATYIELLGAANDEALLAKIRFACMVAAETIRTELATTLLHTERFTWAKGAFSEPDRTAHRMVWVVLAQNRALPLGNASTPNTILGATDAQVQTAVDNAVNVFATPG